MQHAKRINREENQRAAHEKNHNKRTRPPAQKRRVCMHGAEQKRQGKRKQGMERKRTAPLQAHGGEQRARYAAAGTGNAGDRADGTADPGLRKYEQKSGQNRKDRRMFFD